MNKISKKGLTLKDAFPAVLIVSVVAILFVALIYVFTAFQSIPADISYNTTNESFTVTTAGTTLSNASACGFSNFAVQEVRNDTGYLLNTGNYTTTAAGTIANASSAEGYGTTWRAFYTYTDKGSTCSASASLTTQFVNQIPLVGLVLTIVLIAIVIGVLVTSFFLRNKERI